MEGLFEKHGKGKVFIACFCLFAALLIAEAVFLRGFYNTISYEGRGLSVRKVSDAGVIMADRDGNELVMAVISPQGWAFQYIEVDCEITYLSETIRYSFGYGDEDGRKYTFSDGSTFAEPMVTFSVVGSAESTGLTQAQEAEKELIDRLLDYYYNYKGPGIFVGYVFFGLFILLLAHGTFFYSEGFWLVQTFLSVRGGEPTDFYLFMSKLSSVIVAALVYAGLFVIIFR